MAIAISINREPPVFGDEMSRKCLTVFLEINPSVPSTVEACWGTVYRFQGIFVLSNWQVFPIQVS